MCIWKYTIISYTRRNSLRFVTFEEILVCIPLILQKIAHIDFFHLPVFTPQILKLGCALSTGKMSIYLTSSNYINLSFITMNSEKEMERYQNYL